MATRRILSIDGGGVRGVFSAAIIEQMEIETGKRAWEIFDCFVGTSAGSILAAGLAADISAEDLKNTFIKLGEGLAKAMRGEAPKWEDLTPDQKEPLRELCGILYEGTAPDELPPAKDASLMLASILKTLFQKTNGGDKYPRDLKKRLAVVTRNMKLGKVVFFGNFPADQLDTPSFWDKVKRDDDTTLLEGEDPVWRIVLRSAALPPFFAPDGPYLDGGVSPFANPSYAAYVGVQRRLGWNPHKEPLRFYSVGTGYHNVPQDLSPQDPNEGESKEHAEARHQAHLMTIMVDAMMQDINFLQHQVMKRRKAEGTIWYKRYNISFDEKGFNKYEPLRLEIEGMDKEQRESYFTDLAGTASLVVDKLARIGVVVGKGSVRSRDFRDEVTSQPADPSEQAMSAGN